MDNRPAYSEESQFNSHPASHYPPRNPSNLNSNTPMVHPTQRDYPNSGYPQNPNVGRPSSNLHHSSSHMNTAQGQYYTQNIPQNAPPPMPSHMGQSQNLSSHPHGSNPRYPPPPQNSMPHYPPYGGHHSYHPQNYGAAHPGQYSQQPYYPEDYNPPPQPSYTSYPSSHVPSANGGYPRNASSFPTPPPSHDRSPQQHVAPQQITTQPPPPMPTGSSSLSNKPDNIGEFKKKAEEMKEQYLQDLEKMIEKVASIKKDKDKTKQGTKNLDEIQKKLTLLKTLITADFKPNSNFPPRKEILEAAEKQITMWIEEWEKVSSQLDAGSHSGIETPCVNTQPGSSTDSNLEGSEVKKESDQYLMQELGSTTSWESTAWSAELESFALSLPLDDTNFSSNSIFDAQPPIVTSVQPPSNPNPPQPPNLPIRNLNHDMPPESGIIPEAILGKRQAGEESLYTAEDQPPPKYPKTAN